MPRVDRGSKVVEAAEVLSLDSGALERLADWALSAGAVFVTSPSIVSVDLGGEAVRLAIGIGSIVSEEEPPFRYFTVSAPEWVDGCAVGRYEPRYEVLGRPAVTASGVAVALEPRDPPSMMVNSLRFDAELASPEEGSPATLVIQGDSGAVVPAMTLAEDGYTVLATGGRLRDLLEYAVKLYSSCGREEG